jgi:hypothetical protein
MTCAVSIHTDELREWVIAALGVEQNVFEGDGGPEQWRHSAQFAREYLAERVLDLVGDGVWMDGHLGQKQ